MPVTTDWKQRILSAIRDEQYAKGGRAGETPLTILSDTLRRVPSEARSELLRVFVALVMEPSPEDFASPSYWKNLGFLIYDFCEGGRVERLADALGTKLLGQKAVRQDARVFVLRAYRACGGRLDEKQLADGLSDLRASHPLDWLNAAVSSSKFDFAKEHANKLLRNGKLNAGNLALALDTWLKRWAAGVDFDDVFREFYQSAQEGKGDLTKLGKWAIRHGIKHAPNLKVVPAHSRGRAPSNREKEQSDEGESAAKGAQVCAAIRNDSGSYIVSNAGR